jgi:hypothetical protein
MKTKALDFLVGVLFVLAYLLLSGFAGNMDPEVEQSAREEAGAVAVELVCAQSGEGYDAVPRPAARPLLVSQHEPRSAFLLRCVVH